eukprot:PITA_13275
MVEGKPLIIVLYVDDLILTRDDQRIQSCKEDLARGFEMKDMDLMHYFLGMEVWQKYGEVFGVSRQVCQWDTQALSHGEVQAHADSSSWELEEGECYFRRTEGVKLQGFTDANWAGSPSDQKSTYGGIFNLGSAAISWYSRKQRSVALSSAEAEYMAASQVACEAIWMRKILVGLFGQRMDRTVIYCHNQSCIKLSENPFFHDRFKHIDIRYHHL